jgi:hypothetical protein
VQELLKGQQVLDVRQMLHVNVDQMHGIDIEEFPSLIAQTALWLTDHQMNLEASAVLGRHYVRLPLTASANVVHTNALTTDWAEIVPPERLSYILGNPPFVGKKEQSREQKAALLATFSDVKGAGVLDFVACWYRKSVEYFKMNPSISVALVSTNSITQGEQVSILWGDLIDRGTAINFAHRTFKWSNDARGIAAVYCVIIGFSLSSKKEKRIFEYPDVRGEPLETFATTINPYLVDAPNVLITNRRISIDPQVPRMSYGSMPIDNGHLIVSPDEHRSIISAYPTASRWIRKYVGGYEFINRQERYCLWLEGISPSELRATPPILERIERTREYRLSSNRARPVPQPKHQHYLVRFVSRTHNTSFYPKFLRSLECTCPLASIRAT